MSGEACSEGANHRASAQRLPVLEIAKRVGVSRPMVWRWQQRFAEEGIQVVARPDPSAGIPPVPQAKVHAVVERTCANRPVRHPLDRPRHGQAMGLSLRTIQRIWAAR